MPYVLYEVRDHIALITLNRPDRMNALGRELGGELRAAEQRFAGDDDAWIAVYTGAGERAFCAGRDLKAVAESSGGGGGAGGAPAPAFDPFPPDIGTPASPAANVFASGAGFDTEPQPGD